AHHVAEDLIENVGFHRLLHEMPRTLLQGSDDVLLVSDGGDHYDARLGILSDNPLRSLDAFHLRHGDVHQYQIGMDSLVLCDCGAAVARFAHDFAAERLQHLGEVLAREDRVVDYQISHWLVVPCSNQCSKLLHDRFSLRLCHTAGITPGFAFMLPIRFPFVRPSLPECSGESRDSPAHPAKPLAWHARVRLQLWACQTPRRNARPELM